MRKWIRRLFWFGFCCLPIYDYWQDPNLERLVWAYVLIFLLFCFSWVVFGLMELSCIGHALLGLFARDYGRFFKFIGYGILLYFVCYYLFATMDEDETVPIIEAEPEWTENEIEYVGSSENLEHEYIDLWNDDRL